MAEEFAKNYTQTVNGTEEQQLQELRNDYRYYSSKYSNINGKPCTERAETRNQCMYFKVLRNANESYKDMNLAPDKHFYNINVNTKHTSVHVPTNVFDGGISSFFSLNKITQNVAKSITFCFISFWCT